MKKDWIKDFRTIGIAQFKADLKCHTVRDDGSMKTLCGRATLEVNSVTEEEEAASPVSCHVCSQIYYEIRLWLGLPIDREKKWETSRVKSALGKVGFP